MVMFPANPERMDPYKNFKFRVRWEGRYVAGVSQVSSLRRTTEAIQFREGGDPSSQRVSPGQTSYEPITLSRGLTQDREFNVWARQVWNLGAGLGMEVALRNFRKDITIEFYNEAGQLVLAYNVFRTWPSEFTALPDLDSNGNDIAIQTLVLQNEGWELDEGVQEPAEPAFP
ncbi:MAG: phage tail protein [Acidobacteriota bacterium]